MEQDGQPQRKAVTFANLVSRFFPGRRRRALTGEELQTIIEESEADGLINEDEGEMLHSIFEFGDTIVREVMVTRTDMVACPASARLSELLDVIIASGHSRIPIFEGTIDRIVGVIYAKDLLRHWGKSDDELPVTTVMRTPFFVPETKGVEELLQDFRQKRVHMALAIDEYGGISGLITIEDLIEEIVGDIQDEYDAEEEWLIHEEDGSVIVDGRLGINDLEEHFDIELPSGNVDTVGGYLVSLFGHVPANGDEICDHGLMLTVLAADPRRVRRIRIRRSAEQSDA